MDIGKAFSFVFDDEQWLTSILIAGLLALIPLVGQILIIGYMLETARRLAAGNPRPLPQWDNFGEKFNLGLVGLGIAIVYAVPVIVIALLFACVPLFAAGAGDAAAGIAALLVLCLMPLIMIVALATQPLLIAGTVRYLQTNSFSEALNFSAVITMVRGDLGGWVVLWLLQILCGLVASAGGIIVIGILFTLPYSQAVFGHLMGQKLIALRTQNGYNSNFAPPASPMV
ncbi:DUF4013 domain-containing protein [Candidatus Chloroploca asiatica]|uniref:DUF4013 domain-containing protein n=1 Tax=Candidatus Chloroploca asiatica TaxID=1506545 RepID=A0A2H3KYV9_9CHLR|nr:DUF4013 domain-containing protein [Candidatus Chloroploca asiatica]PDV97531.1 hypothetical protein A9Q02_17905 [Candidatus Chloroploca asiatica]